MPYVEALVPSIALGLLFWYIIKGISNADRKERQAEAEADAVIAQHAAQSEQSSGK